MGHRSASQVCSYIEHTYAACLLNNFLGEGGIKNSGFARMNQEVA
jgi:hypothetical protein